jgi:polyphosphate kinase
MQRFIPKELSWLSFNERVLQEAEDRTVPLIERVRFLGIFSNNMDEFYRVRVANVRRLATFGRNKDKDRYNALLESIRSRVSELQKRFDSIYAGLMDELSENNIYLVNETQLLPHQAEFVSAYFYDRVLSELSPVLFTEGMVAPELDEASIYLAMRLELEEGVRYGLVKVPTDTLPRFIVLPPPLGKRKKVIIVLDNIIRYCLKDVLRGTLDIKDAEAFTIKLTRDAELELGDGITQSLMDKISSSLKKRNKADPVRFVYDGKIPEDLLDFLIKKVRFGQFDRVSAGGRYHNSKDFIKFPNLGAKKLENKPLPAIRCKAFEQGKSIFDVIREKDVLLYYPYHTFRYVEDLLYTAAIDPKVKSIEITLYRVADQSHIVTALINAAKNQKHVTAVVELQARFDEQANLHWAERLTEAGVKVIFGVPGLKVHSKLILIERQEGSKSRYYVHLGTGNFNEKTARIYTDLSLFTYNQDIAKEAAQVFEFIRYNYKHFDFKHLAVSPHSNRSRLMQLIENETAAALQGEKAGITIKCNNLVDNEVVNALYAASAAGVKVKLIIRGMCSLKPGVEGLSENIQAISIIDRFLEHPRIYIFENKGDPQYFLSSADLMTRNLDLRVEVTCPIYDEQAKALVQGIIDWQWKDNMKARILDHKQGNDYRLASRSKSKKLASDSKEGPVKRRGTIRSQERIHAMIANLES